VLLTFDKRLLQAVRLVQSWNEAWSGYLDVESCQTFWVWYLTDAELAMHSAAATFKEVMEDFRLKSRQLFLPTQITGGAIQYLLAGSGSWEEAEEICRGNLRRVDHGSASEACAVS
jgi:hypothetical protein